MEDARLRLQGEVEDVHDAENGTLRRLDGILLIVDRRGRAGEVVDFVELAPEGLGDVVQDEGELGVPEEVVDVGLRSGEEVVQGRHLVAIGKQAAAAVGQCELMYTYDKLFLQYNQTVAQILLTAEDLRTPDRHMKFENTMQKLLELRALPIINENDTVSTDEIKIGDNDTLAAIVAESTGADLLVLMSDIDGLYDKDPHKFDNAVLFLK